jgi:hypothetical protein
MLEAVIEKTSDLDQVPTTIADKYRRRTALSTTDTTDASKCSTRNTLQHNDITGVSKYRRHPLTATEVVDDSMYNTHKALQPPDTTDTSKYRRRTLPTIEATDGSKSNTHKALQAIATRETSKCVKTNLSSAQTTFSAKSNQNARSRHRLNGTRCDTVSESPYATVSYNSALVDDSMNGHPLVTVRSNVAENDRQLMSVDVEGRSHANGHLYIPLHRSLLNSISQLLGIQTTDSELLIGGSSLSTGHTKHRDLKVRLCMNDPLISEEHRMAHRLYVTGKPIAELRAAGIEAVHLSEIGVTYDDWSQCCDLGVRDLVFLNADWQMLLRMGFQPRHIVGDRSKAGANVLSEPPLCVNYQTLEDTLGLTIDEAVFTLAFTTADFAILGETVATILGRGFNLSHIEHMHEPVFNFETALHGSPSELYNLFPIAESTDNDTSVASNNTRKKLPTSHKQPTAHKQLNVIDKLQKPAKQTKKAFNVF